jgi:hypothetical protein
VQRHFWFLHTLGAPVDAPDDWTATADQLIGAGVTARPDKLALVLAGLAGGMAPSTIARKVGVMCRWSQRHCGQPSLPIIVTRHVDGIGGSLNDGITSHRGE